MAAYVILDIEVTDPEGYEEYKRASGSVARYGGTFPVCGGAFEVLEGDWTPHRLVVIRFDSMERAREWWDSEDYRPARRIRERTARTNVVLVEGT
jgi:uncharacterized protein (DUF1330 family)